MKLMDKEGLVLEKLADVWNAFMDLPCNIHKDNNDDIDEFRCCIHQLQNMIAARPTYRQVMREINGDK